MAIIVLGVGGLPGLGMVPAVLLGLATG